MGVTLSSFGGLIGLALATAASMGLTQAMQLPYVFNPQITVTAFAFAAAIGVLFGYCRRSVPRGSTRSRR